MTGNKQISKQANGIGKECNIISIMHISLNPRAATEMYRYFEKGIILFIKPQSLYIKTIQGGHFTCTGLTKK